MAFDVSYALTVVGWVVTAGFTTRGWYVTQRAQRSLFRCQVLNNARTEIVAALRAKQDVVGSLGTAILLIQQSQERGMTAAWHDEDWDRRRDQLADLIRSDQQTSWMMVLEQYEVLFPKSRSVRRQLSARERHLMIRVGEFGLGLMHRETRPAALASAKKVVDELADTSALMEDLLVYVQNETLGKVFATQASYRQPNDARAIRIVAVSGGELEIRHGVPEEAK